MGIFYLLFGAVLPLLDLPIFDPPRFSGEAIDEVAVKDDGKEARCIAVGHGWEYVTFVTQDGVDRSCSNITIWILFM
jgi:hypothetical protein